MPTRFLVVGLDSAEPLLVRRWMSEGHLPTLSHLCALHEIAVENFPGFGNGVYWPSLNTGGDPSFHSRYYRRQLRPPTYSLEPFDEDSDMKRAPFWATLDADGLKVAVVDPVETGICRLSNGLEIVRWMSHGRTGPPTSSPVNAIGELIARYGDDPFQGNSDLAVKNGLKLEDVIEGSRRRIETKTMAMLELLGNRDWDMFYVTFADPHDLGHLAWHLHEQNETSKNNSELPLDPLLLCYRELDASLARLMDAVESGGETMVLLGPGMERNVGANPLLPEILRQLQGRPRSRMMGFVATATRAISRSPVVPRKFHQNARNAKARLGLRVQIASRRPYYSVPHNDNAGAIRLNVAGREPYGTVPSGKAYDELCARLSAQLLQIKDASGNLPLVSQIIKTHDHYVGPEVEVLPDLMVVWNRNADVREISSPEIGTLRNPGNNVRSGDHSTRGLVICDSPITTADTSPINPAEVTAIILESARRQATRHISHIPKGGSAETIEKSRAT